MSNIKSSSYNYRLSKKGLTNRIYSNQVTSSKTRGFMPPEYTLIELREWVFSNALFDKLYTDYVNSDYCSDLVPSVDRKNDYIHYTLQNIQLMTWKENEAKGNRDRKNGKNNKQNKAVLQYRKNGELIEEYHSIHEAERRTGVDRRLISGVCLGKHKSSYGFVWKFKKDNS